MSINTDVAALQFLCRDMLLDVKKMIEESRANSITIDAAPTASNVHAAISDVEDRVLMIKRTLRSIERILDSLYDKAEALKGESV